MAAHDESALRLGVFAAVWIVMALGETLWPRRARSLPRRNRWITNTALVMIDTVALRLVLPVLAVDMALIANQRGWGLLAFVPWPLWIKMVITVVVLDLLIYAQHVASHAVGFLWRFHKVHHVDRDLDVTTGVRFHPIEIILSMAYKVVCVIALGAPAAGVFLFEMVLNAAALFNHANIKIPHSVDRVLRQVIVTPDMHRVHHSTIPQETDSNYGFCLSLWDRLFKTYTVEPAAGHTGMTIGLIEHQNNKPARLLWCLGLPFLRGRV